MTLLFQLGSAVKWFMLSLVWYFISRWSCKTKNGWKGWKQYCLQPRFLWAYLAMEINFGWVTTSIKPMAAFECWGVCWDTFTSRTIDSLVSFTDRCSVWFVLLFQNDTGYNNQWWPLQSYDLRSFSFCNYDKQTCDT